MGLLLSSNIDTNHPGFFAQHPKLAKHDIVEGEALPSWLIFDPNDMTFSGRAKEAGSRKETHHQCGSWKKG